MGSELSSSSSIPVIRPANTTLACICSRNETRSSARSSWYAWTRYVQTKSTSGECAAAEYASTTESEHAAICSCEDANAINDAYAWNESSTCSNAGPSRTTGFDGAASKADEAVPTWWRERTCA